MWKSAFVGVYQLLNWEMHGKIHSIKLFMAAADMQLHNSL